MLVKEIGVPVPVPSDLLMLCAGLQLAAGLYSPLVLPADRARAADARRALLDGGARGAPRARRHRSRGVAIHAPPPGRAALLDGGGVPRVSGDHGPASELARHRGLTSKPRRQFAAHARPDMNSASRRWKWCTPVSRAGE